MIDFLVKRDDFRQTRIAESDTPSLVAGQALLRVDTFGLTANNVTYAVFGDGMNYWDFFPAEDGWGRVPMWGFAEVEASEADGRRGRDPGLRIPAALLEPDRRAGGRRWRQLRRRLRSSETAALRLPPLPGDRIGSLLPGGDRGGADAAPSPLLHLVPARRPARRRRAHRPRPDRDLERLEQDLARGGVPAEPARRRRSRRAHLGPQRGFRRRTRHLRPSGRPTRRSSRSGPARRPTSTSPATATCGRRSTPTSATGWSRASPSARPIGRSSAPTPASSRARRRPSSSPLIASQSGRRTGAARSSRRGSRRHGTPSASGRGNGWRRSRAPASRPSRALFSTSSKVGLTPGTPTCSRSGSRTSSFPVLPGL